MRKQNIIATIFTIAITILMVSTFSAKQVTDPAPLESIDQTETFALPGEPHYQHLTEDPQLPLIDTALPPEPPPIDILRLECFRMEKLVDRIECRLNSTQIELNSEPYSPEGCKTLSEKSQKNCQDLYTQISYCYEKPVGPERINCIKNQIGFTQPLKPLSEQCGEDQACRTQYQQKIINLVGARLYDAEERAEEFTRTGRIKEIVIRDFLVFITESKWELYNATTNEERKAVVNKVQIQWDKLINQL